MIVDENQTCECECSELRIINLSCFEFVILSGIVN